jgi:SPP1 family predicted phage head-tail adaptor
MIGDFNRRVTVKAWGSTQDEAGGVIPTLTASYTIWAKVEDRSGQVRQDEQQREWNYDYKVTFRYEKYRVVTSGMTIDYDGKRLAINSISYFNEGNRKEVVARCSTQDVLVNASNDGIIVEPDGLSRILVEVNAGTSEAIEAGIIVGASSYTNSRMINRDIEVNRGGHAIANIQQTGSTEYVTKAFNSNTVYFSSPIYFWEYIKITLA